MLEIVKKLALKIGEVVTVHKGYDRCMRVLCSVFSLTESTKSLYGDFNTCLYFIQVLSPIKIQPTPLFQLH